MYSKAPVKSIIQIVDTDGTTILEQSITLRAGNNSILIPAGKLGNGVYFIRERKGDKEIVRKLIIKR
jgi:hypothetical protein